MPELLPPPKLDLRQALRDADWETILPGLISYAASRLRRVGWASGRDIEPSKMGVEQLVNSAIEACLDGSRNWDSNAVDLPGFLRGVIRSLASSEKKKAMRAKTFPRADVGREIDAVAARSSTEDDLVVEEGRQLILKTIEESIADDDDLRAFYRAIVDDGLTKREEIAKALGWTPQRVTATRIKLQRRLLVRRRQQPTPKRTTTVRTIP